MMKIMFNELLQKADKEFVFSMVPIIVGEMGNLLRHSFIIVHKDLQEIHICDFHAFKLMQGKDWDD